MPLFDFFRKSKKEQKPRAAKKFATDAKTVERVRKQAKKAGVRKKVAKEGKATRVFKESKVAWRVLARPHVTEKSTGLTALGQYTFRVFNNTTKQEVKRAIEDIYGVHVVGVRKISVPRKRRRRGRQIGWKSGYIKAIVSLKKGDKIEVLPH